MFVFGICDVVDMFVDLFVIKLMIFWFNLVNFELIIFVKFLKLFLRVFVDLLFVLLLYFLF